MGAHSSSPSASGRGRRVMNTTSMQGPEGTVQSGAHTELPEDGTAFPGPKIEYLFTSITARRSVEEDVSSDGAAFSLMTTDVESYRSTLAQAYQDGFTLTKFQAIPGISSPDVHCQGIFTRPAGLCPGDDMKLEIVRSYIKPQEFFSVTEWSTNNEVDVAPPVMTKVREMSRRGARFICMELTGKQTDSSSQKDQGRVVGVDLFFHAPLNPEPCSFVYRSINVPVTYSMLQMDDGLTMYDLQYICHTDLQEQLTTVLRQGWKLVDICLDSSSLTKSDAFSSGYMTICSMWFFEKEASQKEDSVACWEGTIISYQHQVKHAKNAKKLWWSTWDPILVEMGQRGWELACILETPEVRQTGSHSRTTTLLLFFQRPVIAPASEVS